MPLTRRNFLISGSLSLAAGALSPLLVQAGKAKSSAPADFKDWESVRREFELAPDYIHLALFFLAFIPSPSARRLSNIGQKSMQIRLLPWRAHFSNRPTRTYRCRFAAPLPTTSVAIRRTSH